MNRDLNIAIHKTLPKEPRTWNTGILNTKKKEIQIGYGYYDYHDADSNFVRQLAKKLKAGWQRQFRRKLTRGGGEMCPVS